MSSLSYERMRNAFTKVEIIFELHNNAVARKPHIATPQTKFAPPFGQGKSFGLFRAKISLSVLRR